MEEEKKIFGYTDFKTALYWCHNEFVLLNKVPELDIDVVSEYESWYRQNLIDNEGYTEEEAYEEYPEVYQWLVTDASKWDLDYLEKTFGIKAFWSDVLDCSVIPVTHFGTSWNYVSNPVYSEQWWRINKEEHEFKH